MWHFVYGMKNVQDMSTFRPPPPATPYRVHITLVSTLTRHNPRFTVHFKLLIYTLIKHFFVSVCGREVGGWDTFERPQCDSRWSSTFVM